MPVPKVNNAPRPPALRPSPSEACQPHRVALTAGDDCGVAARSPNPLVRLALIAFPVALAGCTGVLSPAGPVAEQQRTILFNSVAIMLCIIVPVIVLAIGFAWWFRAGNTRATRRPDFVFSGKIEIVMWSIPALVVFFLGSIAWIGSHELDPRVPLEPVGETVEIQVVAMDWKWLFLYPEAGVASLNRLVVPAGVPLRLRITSASVMNAFFVPRLGSMIYAMNGMETMLHLKADEPGTMLGLSSHYSGDGFSDMNFPVEAVTDDDFARWLETAGSDTRMLDRAAYETLAIPSQAVPEEVWGRVEPGLFDRIVSQEIPPSVGRPEGQTPGAATPPQPPAGAPAPAAAGPPPSRHQHDAAAL